MIYKFKKAKIGNKTARTNNGRITIMRNAIL